MARYARQYSRMARGAYKMGRRKSRGALKGIGLNLSMGFLGGLAAGVSNLDNRIPADIKIAAAAAPVSGLGMIKGIAQGMIIGDIVQKRLGFRLPVGSTSGSQPAFTGF